MLKKRVVLLVDDDKNLLAGLRRQLHSQPFEVVTVDGSVAAMAVLKSQDVDVVVSDENMPGVSGIEFLSEISKSFPSTMRIMLSGQAGTEVVLRAVNEGRVFSFLPKPCDTAELAKQICRAIEQRQLLSRMRG